MIQYLKYLILILMLIFMMTGCNQKKEENVSQLISEGEFSNAEFVLGKKIRETRDDSIMQEKYIIQQETLRRIRKEFPYNRADLKKQFEKYYPDLNDEQLDEWEASGQLEMRVIDGEKRYFSRAVSNFFRLNAEAKQKEQSIVGPAYDGVKVFQQEVIPAYFEKGIAGQEPFDRQRIKITYTMRLKPNQVPPGETVRCWMPYPRIGQRLSQVELLETGLADYIISPPETLQRSIYMEQQAIPDSSTVFSVSYIIHTAAQWFNIKPEAAVEYDKTSKIYQEYTKEELPHIVLNDDINLLAHEIAGDETNPVNQVKLLYYWINDNIPWAGALEYSVMDCIPEYVLEHRRGDCGMQTFLFLSMARSLGIPCKWQSGWYLLPQEKNLHDWAEVYYEGIGWVPVDLSFKLIDSDDIRIKEFYLNGMDPYRLIINDDVAREFVPAKRYYRSEPYDFQRGELEWKGANLYFDTWSYHMDLEYLED